MPYRNSVDSHMVRHGIERLLMQHCCCRSLRPSNQSGVNCKNSQSVCDCLS